MKRGDRLYALMQRLKSGQLQRAEDMARDLGVSVRTIYRDMDALAASGVPVSGARGVGYTAQAAITLPPLNLTPDELGALHLALEALGRSGLDEMAAAARSLSAKIEAVLPEDATSAPNRFGLADAPVAEATAGFAYMPAFRAAIRARQKLRVTRDDGPQVHRPLALDYWGRVWTCVVWNEASGDFASYRLDHVRAVQVLPGLFVDEPGKRLVDHTRG